MRPTVESQRRKGEGLGVKGKNRKRVEKGFGGGKKERILPGGGGGTDKAGKTWEREKAWSTLKKKKGGQEKWAAFQELS